MFPSVVSAEIERALLDYLRTTLRLRDKAFEEALFRFLRDEQNGMFRGPYLDVRLPFRKAPEDWVPLRPDAFYSENDIHLQLSTEVTGIDPELREVALAGGNTVRYDRLLLATGAEPVRLWIPGADQTEIHSLRSLADCRAIIARAETARKAVILGASFIGLEVAAALRSRGIEVHVVAPEKLRSTAQGILSMVGSGLAGILSNFTAGWLVDRGGTDFLYLSCGIGSLTLGILSPWILPAVRWRDEPVTEVSLAEETSP